MRTSRVVLPALLAAAALLCASAASAGGPPSLPGAPQQVHAAFFANWDRYARGYTVAQIPADRLDVIDYAFAKPAADGTCALTDAWSDYQAPTAALDSVDGVADDASDPNQHLFGNFEQLVKLKAAHPGLRVVMSLGGWTGSTYFSDVAATAASRQAFVASCIGLIVDGNLPTGGWPTQAGGPGAAAGLFDGVDVDWEYPGKDPGNGAHTSPADTHDATLLLQEFRRQLDAAGAANGRHYLLTADLPAGNVNASTWELPQATRPLDWVNLETFDFHGSWDAITDFNSPLTVDPREPPVGGGAIQATWSTAGSVAYYLLNGVPAGKLVVAVPFYGKRYVGVPAANDGLFQPFSVQPWPFNDTPTFHELVDTGLTDANLNVVGPTALAAPHGLAGAAQGINGFTAHVDRLAGAPWLYAPAVDGGTFISFLDPRAIAERARLASLAHLRGLWAWEISQDDDAHDLVDAMTSGPGR
jgi:chitinase